MCCSKKASAASKRKRKHIWQNWTLHLWKAQKKLNSIAPSYWYAMVSSVWQIVMRKKQEKWQRKKLTKPEKQNCCRLQKSVMWFLKIRPNLSGKPCSSCGLHSWAAFCPKTRWLGTPDVSTSICILIIKQIKMLASSPKMKHRN